MLRLLVFAPCEKAIVAEKGQSSVIGIVEQIRIELKKDKPLAVDSLVPFRWTLYMLWHREQEVDEPVKYQAQMKIFRPDETDTGIAVQADFEVTNEFENFRQVVELPVFPAGIEGAYSLKVFLKKTEDEEWEERAIFPVRIEHIKPPEEQNAEQATT